MASPGISGRSSWGMLRSMILCLLLRPGTLIRSSTCIFLSHSQALILRKFILEDSIMVFFVFVLPPFGLWSLRYVCLSSLSRSPSSVIQSLVFILLLAFLVPASLLLLLDGLPQV